MLDLPKALTALADLGIHPLGVTVDQALIALQLSAADQARVLSDTGCRDAIVEILKAHGFLYVTLNLNGDEQQTPWASVR